MIYADAWKRFYCKFYRAEADVWRIEFIFIFINYEEELDIT